MKILELDRWQLTPEQNPNGPDSDTICVWYRCKVQTNDERGLVTVNYAVYRTPEELPHPTSADFVKFVLFRLSEQESDMDFSHWQMYEGGENDK